MTNRSRIKGGLITLLSVAAVLMTAAVAGAADAGYVEIVVLQTLDKVTGRVFTLETELDQPVTFGNLTIVPRRCYKAPPEDLPEAVAFLEIEEQKVGEPARQVFRGWMFASSPGLSTLEHPVYDVIVLDCRAKPEPAEDEAAESDGESDAEAPSSE